MQFLILGGNFRYELEKLCLTFLPFEKFEFLDDLSMINPQKNRMVAIIKENNSELSLSVELKIDMLSEKRGNKLNAGSSKTDIERALAVMLFDCFLKVTNYRSPWGILTGVRPAKLMGRLINTLGKEKAVDYFKNELLVSDKKTNLCLDTYISEEHIIEKSKADSFSLYVSIPFCPSRCAYCSFVSHSVDGAKKLIPQYVDLLIKEIKYTAEIVNRLGLKLLTVYIGGGTPTTLSAEQLTLIMNTIKDNFDLSNILEYTVEAGRPDTVTKEKLVAIKTSGATRISINPQTMNDDVLGKIGRRHTAKQMKEAFLLAREIGFDNINTDLIAGLEGDNLESFKASVDEIIALNPENVTVHSLSMKRASNLSKLNYQFLAKEGEEAAGMVDYALNKLTMAGIYPYYMYRQSKTIGNLENVGYSKVGYECLYNVYIMDETHSIIGCGASAVTKLREPNGNNIERIFNFKYPYEYISNFSEMLERKKGIAEFYDKYPVD